MKINQKNILAIFIFFSMFATSKYQIFAQTDINLSVSPPISYLQVPPGTTRTHTIVLENNGNNTVTVTPSIVDFSSDGKTGRAIISNKLSFPYITFGKTKIKQLSIPPQQKAQLTLYIDVPKEAKEQEYPLTILFFSKKNDNSPITKSSRSRVSGAIGSNLVILVSNKSKLDQTLKILDLNTPKIIDSFGKIKFSPLVKNNSFASISASGSAKIKNWKNKLITEFEIYPDVVLGSSTRELRALREGITPDKPETGSFSYKPKFLLGSYKIEINLINGQQQSIKYIKTIYAFPFSIILIFILGGLTGLVYLKKIKQKYN